MADSDAPPQPDPDDPQGNRGRPQPNPGAAQPNPGAAQPNPEKDPADWVTGDEPATGPQMSYLGTLAQEAGQQLPAQMTKADASKLIEELQARTGRGSASSPGP